MTMEELRKECGIGPDECPDTSMGAVDFLSIDENDIVTLGFIAISRQVTEPAQDVIDKFKQMRTNPNLPRPKPLTAMPNPNPITGK